MCSADLFSCCATHTSSSPHSLERRWKEKAKGWTQKNGQYIMFLADWWRRFLRTHLFLYLLFFVSFRIFKAIGRRFISHQKYTTFSFSSRPAPLFEAFLCSITACESSHTRIQKHVQFKRYSFLALINHKWSDKKPTRRNYFFVFA